MKKRVVEESKVRIDKYLSEFLNISRSKVNRLIESNNILVNDEVVKKSCILNNGDVISYSLEEEIVLEKEDIEINVVYEDSDILVVNKQNNIIVHPTSNINSNTLVNGLINYCNLSSHDVRPGIVHRLDKKTTGLLVVAKTDKSYEVLKSMFKEKKIVRKYICLVNGIINHDTGTIDAPIARSKINPIKMDIDSSGKSAITHFKVLKRFKNSTLVECTLDTGRTHQIRVHFKYINHSIVNDDLYGNKVINDFGQMLHAHYIKFKHPITNVEMEFNLDVPEEFVEILKTQEE